MFLAIFAFWLGLGIAAVFFDLNVPYGVKAVAFFSGSAGVILFLCLLVKFILRGKKEINTAGYASETKELPERAKIPQSEFSVKEVVILITAGTIAGGGLIFIGAAVDAVPSGGKIILIVFGAVLFASSVLQTVIKYALYRRNKNLNAAVGAEFGQTNQNPKD